MYKRNNAAKPKLKKADGQLLNINIDTFHSALNEYKTKIEHIYSLDIDLGALLGMRNLSAVIGELFVQSMASTSEEMFIKNPHQDGYPDLLLMDSRGKQEYEIIKQNNRLKEKAPFSPFCNGGLEVKATCGSIPTQATCLRRGQERPDIGDQRIELMTGYDWKAHHRETNNLIGIIWDFIDKIPTIVSIHYSYELNQNHWGAIVQPRAGGGRTTSVSIMTRKGVNRMYSGWLFVIDDERYTTFFNNYNKNTLM